jgi:hypothetical protein
MSYKLINDVCVLNVLHMNKIGILMLQRMPKWMNVELKSTNGEQKGLRDEKVCLKHHAQIMRY